MNRVTAAGPAERNKRPIFDTLAPLLVEANRVLEIGAGDGTHARHASACLPQVHWQASEHPAHMGTLVRGLDGCRGLPAPVALDVTGAWPPGLFTAVYAANVAHIMSWGAVEALFAGGGSILEADGLLCLYGPFLDDTAVAAASNREFDRRLRSSNPGMGLRRVQALDDLAQHNGLVRRHDWAMPANNRLLVWQCDGSV